MYDNMYIEVCTHQIRIGFQLQSTADKDARMCDSMRLQHDRVCHMVVGYLYIANTRYCVLCHSSKLWLDSD